MHCEPHHRRTRFVTESMGLFFVVVSAGLACGVHLTERTGLAWAVGSLVVASLAQTCWLAWRLRGIKAG